VGFTDGHPGAQTRGREWAIRAVVRVLRFGCTLWGAERAGALGDVQEAGTKPKLGLGNGAARSLHVSSTTAAHAIGMRVSEEAAE